VRSNLRRARLLPLVFGAVIAVAGLVAAAWGSAIALGLDVGPRGARLSLAITAVTFVGLGAFLLRFSRGFHVHWDLASTGTSARAVVISVSDGASAARRRYGPVVVSTSRVRLAVQSDGGTPSETSALSVDQLHGTLTPGQSLTVFVDPAAPLRVFIAEP
jgi:hypothetical protein